ncbi:MAG: stage II sporulation protein M [Eubacteriales bacterium]|nr:stage II sporulation protein M [Eubacteriales bacterium]
MNKKAVTISLLIIAVGICCGTFLEIELNSTDKSIILETIDKTFKNSDTSDLLFLPTFFSYASKNSLILLIMAASSFSIFTLPLCIFLLFFKTMSIGFASSIIFERLGIKGIKIILYTIFPQSLIQIPVFALLSAMSLSFGVLTYRNKEQKKKQGPIFMKGYLIGWMLILISNFIEAFLLVAGS